jgi:hypothetical protein
MSSVLPLPLVLFEEYLLLDDRPGYRMTFLVDQSFDGEIDRDAFDIGVTEASRRHPLLNAFVKRRWYGRRDWVSAGGARPAVDWGHIDQPVEFPEDSGIDLTREVGARFHVRVGNGRSRLITTFHHSCCDGMGAIQFLSDLFAAYTRHLAPNAPKHPAYQPVEERHLLHRGYLPILHDKTMPWFRLFLRSLGYIWKALVHPPMPLARSRPASATAAPLEYPGTLTRTLSPIVQRSLRQLGRRLDVTVNELLVRELLLTIRDWNQRHSSVSDKDHISVLIPTNMRNLDHDQMPAANVMSYLAFHRSVAELSQPDALLNSIRVESQFYKRWRFGASVIDSLKVLRCVPGSLRMVLAVKQSFSSAILSCIGDPSLAIAANFPVNENGDPILGNLVFNDLNTAPPIRPLTHAAFTAWHFANKLRLGLRADSTIFTQESAQELLDSFADRVVALAATSERIEVKRVAA